MDRFYTARMNSRSTIRTRRANGDRDASAACGNEGDAVGHRANGGWLLLESLRRDVQHGFRGLRRAPGFTVMALLTLGPSIAATTLAFAIGWALWLRPLPYSDPDRLVEIEELRSQGSTGVFHATYFALREEATTVDALTAINPRPLNMNVAGRGEPARAIVQPVHPNFFSVLNNAPFPVGRGFVAGDWENGAIAVLSHQYWMNRFGGDPSVVGDTLRLNGVSVEVVGVAPRTFRFPGGEGADLYRPLLLGPATVGPGGQAFLVPLRVIGRLAPGASVASAEAELRLIRSRAAAALFPEGPSSWGASRMTNDALVVQPLHEKLVGGVRTRMGLLAGTIALLLMIAGANVANLQIIRTLERQRELAVRLTLGASRPRLVAQLLTEAVILGSIAALVALAAVGWGMGGLRAVVSDAVWLADRIELDGMTLAFASLLVLMMSLVSVGTALPWVPGLLRGAASGLQIGAAIPRRGWHNLLMGGQVSFALVLLVSAGLLATSLVRLTAIDPGFDPRNLLTFRAVSHVHDPRRQSAFVEAVLERTSSLPGVESVAMTSRLPFEPRVSRMTVGFAGREGPSVQLPEVPADTISPGYFAAMGIRLEAGRDFTPRDVTGASPVVIVNRTFVNRFFPGEPDARIVDHPRLLLSVGVDREAVSIVGIVADSRTVGFADEAEPHIFRPNTLYVVPEPAFLVRTSAEPASIVPAIRAAVGNVHADIPLFDVATIDDRLTHAVGPERMSTLLSGVFGILALLIAAAGVYSVSAHVAAQRRYEIGVRLALGATGAQLVTLVVRQALSPVAVGAVLGIAAALATGRLLDSFLFEIDPANPMAIGGAATVLLGVSMLASYVPARRAARANPGITLKSE